jgi:hypothetical protein
MEQEHVAYRLDNMNNLSNRLLNEKSRELAQKAKEMEKKNPSTFDWGTAIVKALRSIVPDGEERTKQQYAKLIE